MKRSRTDYHPQQLQRLQFKPHHRRTFIQRPPDINTLSSYDTNLRLTTNAYGVRIKDNLPVVYEYDLIITAPDDKSGSPLKVISRNFVARSIRKLLIEQYLPQITSQTLPSSKALVVDNNLEKVYSLKPFKTQSTNENENKFVFKSVKVATDLLVDLLIDITIKHSSTQPPHSYASDKKWSLIISVLHHQPLLEMLRYGPVYYSMPRDFQEAEGPRYDLISKHLMGISLSGLRGTTSGETSVVISCTHSYITRPYRLIDLLATFIREEPSIGIREIMQPNGAKSYSLLPEIQSISGREDWFLEFCAILSGFKCQINNTSCFINLRFNLTEEAADKLMLTSSEGKSISVIEYYKSLGTSVNYPNLPCLKSNTQPGLYYPFELSTLLPCQKVPIFRLSAKARNHLSLLNKPKPEVSKISSSRARDVLENMGKDLLSAFGMEISKYPVEAQGVKLRRPILHFKDKEVEPIRDYWESGAFCHSMHLGRSWCVVNTVDIDKKEESKFFKAFSAYSIHFGFKLEPPIYMDKSKEEILGQPDSVAAIIEDCKRLTGDELKFIMFVIDNSSTQLNRLIHLSFDDQPLVTATCLRADSIYNMRQQRSIFRTLIHKLNARLGGTNVKYNHHTLHDLDLDSKSIMVLGLDVTHPDNELNGVSIVGCAYTYSRDLFKHRSIVWPQSARVEIIGRLGDLIKRLLEEYYNENYYQLPNHIVVYRDGVSQEEFERVQALEIEKAELVADQVAKSYNQPKPEITYIIAQKRHTMRFYQQNGIHINNPPSGTLISKDVVSVNEREFYLFSNTGAQATARPLHYHVLQNGLSIDVLHNLTYYLCFNFGRCSSTLSMPSSLRYAHNAAYDARNRVIAAREFCENRFYTSKFFC